MMQKKLRQGLSIVLSAAMVMPMNVPAYANEVEQISAVDDLRTDEDLFAGGGKR